MLTPAKAVTAGAIVFALAGVMLVAQLDRPPQAVIPGAAIDPCTTSIAPARGVLRWGYFAEPDRIIVTDSSEHVRGGTYVATMEMEDDRLDGRHTSSVEWDFSVGDAGPAANSSGPFDTARAGIFRGTMRIENEDGWWEGPWIATGESTYSWQSVTTLTGAEAYEGLSAMLFLDSSPDATTEVTGSIYPSDIASCEFTAGE